MTKQMRQLMVMTAVSMVMALPALAGSHPDAPSETAKEVRGAGTRKETGTHDATKTLDVVDTAVAAGTFNTLVAAVKAAGLAETLKGTGPFTVFAPTDEAFARLPEGFLESLLEPENGAQLVSILTYHVVPGKVTAADVVKLKNATTAQGQEIRITVENGKVMVDGANVVTTDIAASNGVIHVIDSVILPRSKQ